MKKIAMVLLFAALCSRLCVSQDIPARQVKPGVLQNGSYTFPDTLKVNGSFFVGDPSISTSSTVTGGIYGNANGQLMNNITDLAPRATTYAYRSFVYGKGNNTTATGVGGINTNVADDPSVTLSNKGILYGAVITINPKVPRGKIPYDDATGIIVQNNGTGKATDAIFFGNGPRIHGSAQWLTMLSMFSDSDYGILMGGIHSLYGIDLQQGTYGASPLRLPFKGFITARNGTNSADIPLVGLGTGNTLFLGGVGVNTIGVNNVLSGVGGSAVTARGGAGASYDLVVQDAAASRSNLLVSDAGDVMAHGNVTAGEGTKVVYRCTTAGTTLPVGSLTIDSAACGASTDTGLRVK